MEGWSRNRKKKKIIIIIVIVIWFRGKWERFHPP